PTASSDADPMPDDFSLLNSSLSGLEVTAKESNHEETPAGSTTTFSSLSVEPGRDPWAISTKTTKGDFVSVFLHRFAQRSLPSDVNIPVTGLEGWLHRIRLTLEEPHCEDAKRLLKENPSAVLFAQQMHLVRACGLFIEEMAQRA
ncbi:12373_t:CDS:2, partial [Acaulospora colombiana]